VFAGACRFELFDELEELESDEFELDEPDDFEDPELDEPEPVEPEPVDAEPPPEVPEPVVPLPEVPEVPEVPDFELDEELPTVDLLVFVTAACDEPGSARATAPAAATLAKPTVAVVAFSLRLPRSRSSTASDTLREGMPRAPWARGPWGRGAGLRKSR
jgi:hypothetical protein